MDLLAAMPRHRSGHHGRAGHPMILYTFGYASLQGADDLRELLADRARTVI